jgi:TPP-dependent indolepyruvate ferredoxin oxidoreductase alpha subunit
MDDDFRQYAIRQLMIAIDKFAEAPGSAAIHELQAAFALRGGRPPVGTEAIDIVAPDHFVPSDRPVFCAHCDHRIYACPRCGKMEWRIE